MATLFARHDVADFDAWKKAYDAFDDERREMGVVGDGVYRADGNRNDVTVYHEFESMEEAKAFAGGERLKQVMMEAGVQGQPTIWFAERV